MKTGDTLFEQQERWQQQAVIASGWSLGAEHDRIDLLDTDPVALFSRDSDCSRDLIKVIAVIQRGNGFVTVEASIGVGHVRRYAESNSRFETVEQAFSHAVSAAISSPAQGTEYHVCTRGQEVTVTSEGGELTVTR
jgi:hypothetical protein